MPRALHADRPGPSQFTLTPGHAAAEPCLFARAYYAFSD